MLNKGCWHEKFVVRSVTDVLRTQSRFVKWVGVSPATSPPPPTNFTNPLWAWSTSVTDLITLILYSSAHVLCMCVPYEPLRWYCLCCWCKAKIKYTVKPVHNGQSMEKQQVAVVGRWPLYRGSKLSRPFHLFSFIQNVFWLEVIFKRIFITTHANSFGLLV